MIADRVGHALRLALRGGVRAAHVTLELGELADHQGHEVALAEARRARDRRLALGVEAERVRDVPGEPLDALDLLAHRAEPVVKDDAAELLEPRVERRLLVLLKEEARVREARAHDAIVALRDEVRAVRGVHDGEVRGEELAVAALDAEVLLVPARDCPDDGPGQREERAIEGAGHDVRLLDERRVLVHERRLGIVGPAGDARRRFQARDHRLYPLVAIDEHVSLAELIDVRLRARHHERRGREEPVAARLAAARHPCEGELHDLVPEERDDPLNRAAEGRVQVCPAHRLPERDGGADPREHVPEQLRGRTAALDAPPDDVPSGLLLRRARSLDDRERVDRNAELCGECLGGLGRLAVLEGGGLRRADDLFVEIELPGRHVVHDDREAAGRPERRDRTVRQAGVRELVGDDLRQRHEGGVDERRGQLLGADLEQKGEDREHEVDPRSSAEFAGGRGGQLQSFSLSRRTGPASSGPTRHAARGFVPTGARPAPSLRRASRAG